MRLLCVCVLTFAFAVPASAQAAACPAGKVAWKLEGKRRCLPAKTVKVRGSAVPSSSVLLQTGLRSALADVRVGRRTLRAADPRVVRRLRAALPRLAAAAGKLQQRLEAVPRPAGAAARSRLRAAPAPIFKATQALPSSTPGVSGSMTGTVNADGTAVLTLDVAVAVGSDAIGLSIDLKVDLVGKTDSCPDAEGHVRSSSTGGFRVTTRASSGGRRTGGGTTTVDVRVDTVGQVGDDGFLHEFSSTVTTNTGVYRSGLQIDITSAVPVKAQATGAFTLDGTPRVDARVRGATFSRADEREVEALVAQRAAADGNLVSGAAGRAERTRSEITAKQPRWTDLDRNGCIRVTWNPAEGHLEPGEQLGGIQGTVVGRDGQPVAPASNWTVEEVHVGQFTGGAGGVFTAKGGQFGGLRGDTQTVLALVIAAGRSGRVRGDWEANGTLVPLVVTGHLTQSEVYATGDVFRFTIDASWQRPPNPVTPDPDGVRRLLYDQTGATVSHWSYDTSPSAACVYHGEGSGGTPVEGDLELDLDADGRIHYGFVSEVNLGTQPLTLVSGGGECPATAPADNLVAFMQARRRPGSDLYDAPAGALAYGKLTISAAGVTDTIATAPGQHDVTADWSLFGEYCTGIYC